MTYVTLFIFFMSGFLLNIEKHEHCVVELIDEIVNGDDLKAHIEQKRNANKYKKKL